MPEVYAVEIAYRQRAAAKLVGECIKLTEDFHVGGFSGGSGWGVRDVLSMRVIPRATASPGLTVVQ